MSEMEMSFWFSTSVKQFLFSGFTITTPLGFVMTCLAVMSFALLFEVLKLKVQTLSVQQSSRMKIIMNTNVCPNDCHSSLEAKKETHTRYGQLLQQVLLYMIQNIIGYFLMLAVMTYNGYFTLSVVLGGGLGYLLFGQGFMRLQLETASLKKNCPACKEHCGEVHQSGRASANTESRQFTVLEEYSKEENDEAGHMLETCSC